MREQALVKMRYTQRFGLFTDDSTMAVYKFRGNSIYDADFTSAGGQPMGHDEWSQFFHRYQVVGSSVSLKAINSPGLELNYMVGILPQTNTDVQPANMDALIEAPHSRHRIMAALASRPALLKASMSTKKLFGWPGLISTHEGSTAVFGTNPSNTWLWVIGIQQLTTAGVGTVSVDFEITITYRCRLFQRLTLTES